MTSALDNRLQALVDRGVIIVDPRQTYVDGEVRIDRISPHAVLYPGTRLAGARTFLGPGARIGTEGPAVIEDSVLGENAEVASGFVKDAVLLRGARLGANAHVRAGTLLEEEASTAHAVGLKHTILLSYATLGSLINFCDGLVSGGTSRSDHSEVGSGFIHFNFTPWGEKGDKATPSLVGDVPRGVFLREKRIFLGGAGGMIGPQKVGFGSVTAAGQVVRRQVPEQRLVCEPVPEIDKECNLLRKDAPEKRTKPNLDYIGQLAALKAWYSQVRLRRIPAAGEYDHLRIVTSEAISTLDSCIQERIQRFNHFLVERTGRTGKVDFQIHKCPVAIPCEAPYLDHVEWVKGVSEEIYTECVGWLEKIAASVVLSHEN